MPSPVLPHLPVPPSLVLASLLYITAGLAYLSLSGAELPARIKPDPEDSGSVARTVEMALVLILALLLWPAGPLLRAARTSPVKRFTTTMSSRSRAAVIRARARRTPRTQEHPVTTEPTAARSGDFTDLDEFDSELDFPGAAARLRVACEQQRLIDAVFMASALVHDVTRRCGPDHPQVLDAMELLAHVAHLVGDEARSVRLYVHVAGRRAWHYGVEYPGAKTALRNAYASWLSASDQAALRTGFLLLPCLRMVAGNAAPITRSSESRMAYLQAAVGSGRQGFGTL